MIQAEKVFSNDGGYIIVSDEAAADNYLMGLAIYEGMIPTWGMYWKDGDKFGDQIRFDDLPDEAKQIWYAEIKKEEDRWPQRFMSRPRTSIE